MNLSNFSPLVCEEVFYWLFVVNCVIKRYYMAVTQYGFLQPKTVQLIQEIEKYPMLYDQEMVVSRSRRQKAWDAVTKACGYSKTEETKNKWRSLVGHMKTHLENVEKKKIRRYIPKTDNPDDQYLQLDDWHYYKYMKFVTPYIKPRKPRVTAKTATKPSTTPPTKLQEMLATTGNVGKTPIQLQIGDMIVKIHVDKSQSAPHVGQQVGSENNNSKHNLAKNVTSAPSAVITHTVTESRQSFDTLQQLPANDQNLKSFFDAMLRSAQRLPKYHQERIKDKLLKVICAQK